MKSPVKYVKKMKTVSCAGSPILSQVAKLNAVCYFILVGYSSAVHVGATLPMNHFVLKLSVVVFKIILFQLIDGHCQKLLILTNIDDSLCASYYCNNLLKKKLGRKLEAKVRTLG